jgi:fructose-specific phosphotransferase system component IIB
LHKKRPEIETDTYVLYGDEMNLAGEERDGRKRLTQEQIESAIREMSEIFINKLKSSYEKETNK